MIFLSLISYLAFLILNRRSDGQPIQFRDEKGEVITIRSKDAEAKANIKRRLKDDGWLHSQIFRCLLLGLPSPVSILWTFVTVGINILLCLFVADFIHRPRLFYKSSDLSFARVGYVSDSTANILIREPSPSPPTIHIWYRSAPEGIESQDTWQYAGGIEHLTNGSDFTRALTIRDLVPATRYEYSLSNNHTGSFVTAPPQGTGKLTFFTSSCIKANFPYNPFSHPLSIAGFRHVATLIPSLHPSFMLFLGDFIYIDVPKRFGFDVEDYRQQYRQVYASKEFSAASQSLPWIHVIDDHDIANDWDKGLADPYPAAIDPWNHYHKSVNPPSVGNSTSYFTFTHGPASFFLLDTRRFRSPNYSLPPHSPIKSMLGSTQLSSLLSFLSDRDPPGVRWKFVISSVPFTRNWRINSADTWAGFLHERNIILEAMWDASARGVGVVIISGDRHEFGAQKFPPPNDGEWPSSATVHEFSCSPLNQFYLPTRSYWEEPGENEPSLKYVPDGNSKFGAIEIESMDDGEQGVLRYHLYVDGLESWQYVVTTPPAHRD